MVFEELIIILFSIIFPLLLFTLIILAHCLGELQRIRTRLEDKEELTELEKIRTLLEEREK